MQSNKLTIKETAVAIRASVRTVYRLIDEGELPKQSKIRARSFLPRPAVEAYLAKQGLSPETE